MLRYLIKIPFLKRLIPSISIRVLKKLKKNRGIFKVDNTRMFLDFLDSTDRQVILHQKYEVEEISILKELIKKYSVMYFFDIGANCGYYSITLAKKFENLKIFAFEPNNDAYEKFHKTLKINPDFSKRIVLQNHGLSDKNSTLTMKSIIKFGYAQTGGSTVNNDYQTNYIAQKALFKIGDKEINIKGSIIALKIDVEGHEINVLKGIKQLLANNKCIIQVEIFNKNFEVVNQFLIDNKFFKITKVKPRPDYFYTNI
tara:strand:+ start:62 stop:829 length:768 start_codon:yes stop_codon:yes gene_type:complete